MSINGQTVQNEATDLYADVLGFSVAPGTNIIVFNLNQPGGTRNQNVWTICFVCYNFFADDLPVAIHLC